MVSLWFVSHFVSHPIVAIPYLNLVTDLVGRANELKLKQRCDGLEIKGVSLHSYRYAWAERALKCGYPERFAQQALGHNSKAMHHAYSKNAEVTVPSLDDWETEWNQNPQGMQKPKLVPVDFRSPAQVPVRDAGEMSSAGAAKV